MGDLTEGEKGVLPKRQVDRNAIQRLIKKGVPLIKNKENNKKILLSISSELKKIASLNTIIQLRAI